MKSCRTCQASYPSDFTVCPQDATPLVEVGTWAEGAVVRGKYRILGKIGQGGFGAVYKAQHMRFDELRALKVITPERANDPSFVKRFFHEAVITRKLQHPNAVRVEDVDEAEDGSPFIVMEYLEGRSLKNLMRDQGRLPAPRVCSLAKQAAMALGAAHNLRMVHRDIKPDNIFIVNGPEGEQVKVLDFGIAKVQEASLSSSGDLTQTKSGMIVGTVQYMSPEQAMGMRGDELDGRSDLYSLGVVMYEMLSGDPPFRAGTTMKILLAHLHEAPPPIHAQHPELQISESIERLVMRLLQKERDARPATADDLINEIERAVAAPGPPLVSTLVAMPTEIVSDWRGENRPGTNEPGTRPEVPQATQPSIVPAFANPPLPVEVPVAPPTATTQQPHVPARVGAGLSSRPSARIEASKSRRSLGVWTKVGLLSAVVLLSILIVSVVRHPGTPNETPAEASARHLKNGDSTRWGDKSFDAVAGYREATRLTPNSLEAHVRLGESLDAKRDTDGAIAEYQEAIRLQPNDPRTLYALGMDLLSKHDWNDAIRDLRTSLQLTPKNEVHDAKGRPTVSENHSFLTERLTKETDVGGATPALRNYIQTSPHDAILHDLLGIALESTGQLQSALAEYRRAFELDPKNSDYQCDFEKLQKRILH